MRVLLPSKPGTFARLAGIIGKAGGDLGAIDLVSAARERTTRDVTVSASNDAHAHRIIDAGRAARDFEVSTVSDRTFLLHLGGKISVENRKPLKTRDDLSMAYTPGVARVCMAIAENKKSVWSLTIKGSTIAVVSDGTAVLGLGDIGPEGAIPVMEGKAMLFKEFGGLNAFPICLATKSVDEIVGIVEAIAPCFGGINLEDISAPRCFEIEERLKKRLDIPVFHDDQHGTAVVVLAALHNAAHAVGKPLNRLKVVVSGVGAAGFACTKILRQAGIREIIGFDTAGAIYRGRTKNMNPVK
jgi:malate dehydrogenase (oxaloacetate-decarboxylating)